VAVPLAVFDTPWPTACRANWSSVVSQPPVVPTTDRSGDADTGASIPDGTDPSSAPALSSSAGPAPLATATPATGTVVPSGTTSTTSDPGSVALGEPDELLLALWLLDPSCQLYVLNADCATTPLLPLPVSRVLAVLAHVSLLW